MCITPILFVVLINPALLEFQRVNTYWVIHKLFITGIVIKFANEINNLGYLLDVEIVGSLIRT
jgi:mannose/fructose/N-acetylgalactosamine-specific phosphotransferase system component IID